MNLEESASEKGKRRMEYLFVYFSSEKLHIWWLSFASSSNFFLVDRDREVAMLVPVVDESGGTRSGNGVENSHKPHTSTDCGAMRYML